MNALISRLRWPVKLARLALRSLSVPSLESVEPGSPAGRRALAFWFEIEDLADLEGNRLCQRYYDGRHPKHYLWMEHNRFIFDNVNPGDAVLDIGCGASQYPVWLVEKAESVTCVDILPERVELARKNNVNPKVSYEVMDVTQGLPDSRFDVAVCSHVLEHLDDPVAMLRALGEAVPRLIVKVPLADDDWPKVVKRDIGIFWMDDADHRREYSETMLAEQLTAAGWTIQQMVRGKDLRAVAVSRAAAGAGAPDADRDTARTA